jgi:hypothetical protein
LADHDRDAAQPRELVLDRAVEDPVGPGAVGRDLARHAIGRAGESGGSRRRERAAVTAVRDDEHHRHHDRGEAAQHDRDRRQVLAPRGPLRVGALGREPVLPAMLLLSTARHAGRVLGS